ncbi:MAG TPA: hypothetical protein VN203_28345 [Candidatus Acidoferrum sp.]|nr:hypothetical protein [Candidatus Acidoferrum sp.]
MYWLVSPGGLRRTIPKDGAVPGIQIQWMDGNTVLISDFHPEAKSPSTSLRLIDLKSGEIRKLYSAPYTSTTYLPYNKTILITISGGQENTPAGVYQVNAADGSLTPFQIPNFPGYTIAWQPELKLVQLNRPDPDNASMIESVFIQPDGKEAFRLKGCSGVIHASPDGKWFTTRMGKDKQVLFDAAGKQVAALGQGDDSPTGNELFRWVSDGSMLYSVISPCQPGETCFYRYAREDQWEPDWFDLTHSLDARLIVMEP